MPLYVADYLADTGHLSTTEHGAYMLLIMHYWQTGGLPNDDCRLASIARAMPEQWSSMRDVLSSFFDADWRHARIESELEKSSAAYERRAKAGQKGGNAKAGGKHCSSNATPLPQQSQSHPQREEKSSLRSDNAVAREAFGRFWAVWPNKVGRPVAEKAFAKVHGDIDRILSGVQSYIREKPPDRSWLNPATFLNQRRWEDTPAPLLETANVQRTQSANGHQRGHDALLAGIAKAAKVFDGDGPVARRADEEIPIGRTNFDG